MVRGEPFRQVLAQIARFIETLSPDSHCSILLLDDNRLNLRAGAAPSLPASFVEAVDGLAIGPACGSCGTAAYRGEQIICEEIATDPLWIDYAEWIISNYQLHSAWSTPVKAANGDVLGTFALYSKHPRVPSDDEQYLIKVCTNLVAIAVERYNTERQIARAQQQAEQADLSKSRFLANLGHELKTPLNAVIGFSEILSEELNENGQTEYLADLEKIRIAGSSLLDMIKNLLEVANFEAGNFELHITEVDPLDLIEVLMMENENEMKAKNNSIKVHSELPAGFSFASDARCLRQIIKSLLDNAIKYTVNGDIEIRLLITAGPETECLNISVADTGIGMNLQQMENIFEAFVQGDDSDTRVFGGNGVGLAISSRLSRLLDGVIRADSEQGKGSVFTVSFPIRNVD
jgi:signal transduction histidine kinase